VPGIFVINIGDMLELWTNGAFVATHHRVREAPEERYSFPLFFNVDYHTEVKPLPQFASESDARRALRAGEHLFAQTAQTFAYLRNRVERGELVLPDGSPAIGQFGQQALQKRNYAPGRVSRTLMCHATGGNVSALTVVCGSTYSERPSAPNSRPMPDCLNPPNGLLKSTMYVLTP
jgi:hypothetical protein